MKRKIFELMLPVESKSALRKSTINIHKHINKVPCSAEELAEPT